MLLRLKLALAFAVRLAHASPLRDVLDLVGAGFAVRALGAGLGLAEHPLVKLLFAACSVA